MITCFTFSALILPFVSSLTSTINRPLTSRRVSSHSTQSLGLHKIHSYSRLTQLQMTSSASEDDIMKFGNTMKIQVKLPCRDEDIARGFIANTDTLLSALWEQGKYSTIAPSKYLLVMNSITLPGFNSITPEIEVNHFLYGFFCCVNYILIGSSLI